jgi:hypothetical protein
MTSKIFASAVLAAAALTSLAASADPLNPYLWEQMKAPSTKTRAQVRAEMSGPPAASTAQAAAAEGSAPVAKSGATLQGDSRPQAPGRTGLVKTGAP